MPVAVDTRAVALVEAAGAGSPTWSVPDVLAALQTDQRGRILAVELLQLEIELGVLRP